MNVIHVVLFQSFIFYRFAIPIKTCWAVVFQRHRSSIGGVIEYILCFLNHLGYVGIFPVEIDRLVV